MSYLKHTVSYGDTLQKLSQSYLGDASRWVELAIVNNLDYPFIVHELRNESTPKNVKALGEELIIPVERDWNHLPLYEKAQEYERLLGEDISAFDGKDFFDFTEGEVGELSADNKGDLKTVKGLENLRQAIILRLLTPRGALLHHPEYGSRFHELVGQKATGGFLQKLEMEISQTIKSDPRVRDITIEHLSYEAGVLSVSLKIFVIGLDDIIQLGFRINERGVIEWA